MPLLNSILKKVHTGLFVVLASICFQSFGYNMPRQTNRTFIELDSIFVRHKPAITPEKGTYYHFISSSLNTAWDSTNIHSLDETMNYWLETKGINDQQKAYLLYTWSKLYTDILSPKSLDLLQQAQNLYQELNDIEGQIYALNDFLQVSYDVILAPGLNVPQKQAHLDLMKLSKKTTDIHALRLALSKRLLYSYLINEPIDRPKLDSLYQEFEHIRTQVPRDFMDAEIIESFSISYWMLNDLNRSLELARKQVDEGNMEDRRYFVSLYNLAYLQGSMFGIAASKEPALKSFRIMPKPKYVTEYTVVTSVLLMLSQIYEAEGKLDSALFFKNKAFYSYLDKYDFAIKTQRVENEYRFGLERKQLEMETLALQKKAADQWNRVITLVVVIVIIALGILFMISKKLRITNKKLRHLIESRDQLIAIIAHDLRSPLKMYQGLAGSIDYLLKKKDWERLHQVGSYIDQTGKDLDIMLNNMLQWGLQQENTAFTNKEKIDLHEIMSNLQSPYRLAARQKDICLNLDISDDETGIGDPAAISVILTNLLDNAIKYSSPDSEITFNVKIYSRHFFLEVANNTTDTSFQRLKTIIENESTSRPGSPHSTNGGFGWMIIKKLLKQINGKVRISGDSKHALLNISLPLSS